jgi:small subunit ribosomal protein S4
MGDPKKQRKKYETPRHPWRGLQMQEELKLVGDYGLRNKHELWKYRSEISRIRGVARSLLAKSPEERARTERDILARLGKLGVLEESAVLDDVLDLNVDSLLGRRLQSVVARSGVAKSLHHARQLIVHGHVTIDGRAVTVPSYLVKKEEEPDLKIVVPTPEAVKADRGRRSRRS